MIMRVRLSILAAAVLACAHSPSTYKPSFNDADLCRLSLTGAESLFVPGRVVILGELHGTAELPRMIEDLSCIAESGGRVHVGLEIPREEQPRIDAFLGAGDPQRDKALEAMLAGPFWKRPFQDGRSSDAMALLLYRVRALRLAGRRVEVFIFDDAEPGQDRDAAMAKNALQAVQAAPRDRFVLLVGNLHARKVAFGGPLGNAKPMAGHLIEAGVPVLSLNEATSGGAAWICPGPNPDSCGAAPIPGAYRGPQPFVSLQPVSDGAYDGILYAGELTASGPAAVKVPEARLKVDPSSPAALRFDAMAAYKRGDFAACAAGLAKVIAQAGSTKEDAYNAACCSARAGKVEDAFAQLKRALELGAPRRQLGEDEDLKALRSDPRWAELTKS